MMFSLHSYLLASGLLACMLISSCGTSEPAIPESAGGKLYGQVMLRTSWCTVEPAANVLVEVESTTLQTRTDANGKWSIANVLASYPVLRFSGDSIATFTYKLPNGFLGVDSLAVQMMKVNGPTSLTMDTLSLQTLLDSALVYVDSSWTDSLGNTFTTRVSRKEYRTRYIVRGSSTSYPYTAVIFSPRPGIDPADPETYKFVQRAIHPNAYSFGYEDLAPYGYQPDSVVYVAMQPLPNCDGSPTLIRRYINSRIKEISFVLRR